MAAMSEATTTTRTRARHVAPVLPRVAALYCRVSSTSQAGEDKTSLQTQEAACRAWAQQQGYLVDEEHIYCDQHTGEELWERPHLTRLREGARARRFGCIVAYSVERLTRNTAHLFILVDDCERLGVRLDFVTGGLTCPQLVRLCCRSRGSLARSRMSASVTA